MGKGMHQYFAMIEARRIARCVKASDKEKARGECLAHLRASLLPVAAGSVTSQEIQVPA